MAHDDSTATFRATGAIRYVEAVFLALWVTVWAIGEALTLGILGFVLVALANPLLGRPVSVSSADWFSSGATSFVVVFLLVWITLWTAAGVAAVTHLLRTLAGVDDLRVSAASLELTRRAGPFRRMRIFDRGFIRRVRIRRHDKALVADTASGTQVLTQFGTPSERDDACRWLRARLLLPDEDAFPIGGATPPDWEIEVDALGTRFARPGRRTRRTQAWVLWIVTAVVSLGWIAAVRTAGPSLATLPALLLVFVLAAWCAWLTWGHTEWVARHGLLTFRRCLASWRSEQRFDGARLEIESSTDSDGDDHFRLHVRVASSERTICKTMYDPTEVVDFARWVASLTGFPLSVPPDLRKSA